MVIIIIFTTLVPVLCVCVCVHACVLARFFFLCLECTHNLTRLFNAYSAPLRTPQRSSILNDYLVFMLMPIFLSVCIMYGSLCFCVNVGELMFVSCFKLCGSSQVTNIMMAKPRTLLLKPTIEYNPEPVPSFPAFPICFPKNHLHVFKCYYYYYYISFCIAESCMMHLLEWSSSKAREYLAPIFELVSMGQSLEI
jgi:hypothetical protein